MAEQSGRREDAEIGGGERRGPAASNVVQFPRHWAGSYEELVPIGPAADRSARARAGGDVTVAPDAADAIGFWDGEPALVHELFADADHAGVDPAGTDYAGAGADAAETVESDHVRRVDAIAAVPSPATVRRLSHRGWRIAVGGVLTLLVGGIIALSVIGGASHARTGAHAVAERPAAHTGTRVASGKTKRVTRSTTAGRRSPGPVAATAGSAVGSVSARFRARSTAQSTSAAARHAAGGDEASSLMPAPASTPAASAPARSAPARSTPVRSAPVRSAPARSAPPGPGPTAPRSRPSAAGAASQAGAGNALPTPQEALLSQ